MKISGKCQDKNLCSELENEYYDCDFRVDTLKNKVKNPFYKCSLTKALKDGTCVGKPNVPIKRLLKFHYKLQVTYRHDPIFDQPFHYFLQYLDQYPNILQLNHQVMHIVIFYYLIVLIKDLISF